MKEIPLTQRKVSLVDDKYFEWLSKFKWYALKDANTFYVRRRNKNKSDIMHRIIVEEHIGRKLKPEEHIDHEDHNGLNNQINNLRVCTHRQNNMNREKLANCSSQYKGVSWNKYMKKWHALIQIEKKRKHLGYFNNEIEAAKAYDQSASEHFGEFANLNFPEDK